MIRFRYHDNLKKIIYTYIFYDLSKEVFAEVIGNGDLLAKEKFPMMPLSERLNPQVQYLKYEGTLEDVLDLI